MANVNDLETIKKDTEPSYDLDSTETIENMTERAAPDALKTGDFVSWSSSGGTARGRISRVERDGNVIAPRGQSFSVVSNNSALVGTDRALRYWGAKH